MKDKGEQLLMASDDERHGFISGETFDLKPVRYYAVEEKHPDTGATINLAMFEGCCVLGTVEEMEATASQVRASADSEGDGDDLIQFGVGITGRRYRWPGGIVPYVIHSGLPNQARVTQAIADEVDAQCDRHDEQPGPPEEPRSCRECGLVGGHLLAERPVAAANTQTEERQRRLHEDCCGDQQ